MAQGKPPGIVEIALARHRRNGVKVPRNHWETEWNHPAAAGSRYQSDFWVIFYKIKNVKIKNQNDNLKFLIFNCHFTF
jgi:hypothetical protein